MGIPKTISQYLRAVSNQPMYHPSESKQSIYEASATPNHRLATLLDLPDGRRFRYAKAGAVALVQAYMAQSAVQESKAVAIVQTGHAQTVGSREISVLVTTASAAAENAFEGGLMCCNKVSPAVLGDVYGILASKLDATDTILWLYLETPIRNAIGATGEVSLTYNKFYNSVVVPTATDTACAVGVPLCPVPIGYYYWSQVRGHAPLIVDTGDTVVIGQYVGNPRTSAVAGACGPVTTVTTEQLRAVWGRAVSIATADEPAIVDLMLD